MITDSYDIETEPMINLFDFYGRRYQVDPSNPQEVGVYAADTTITTANIPETVTYQGTTYNVTYIGFGAFMNCSSLTSVTIPNSVTSIGGDYFYDDGAFQNCSSLTSITIPNSVTSIGDKTFFGCSSLITITIPNSVTYIGRAVFYGCSSLTSVSLGTGITSLMSYNAYGKSPSYGFFHDCSSLTSITIPNSVITIGFGAFMNCSSLTSITIPNSVTSIYSAAFENCSSLTSITIPNSVTSIRTDAFLGCNNLTSMTVECTNIPNLSNIGLNSTLQNLTLEENVTSIASGAFNGYSFLQNVTCLATTPPTLADNTVFPYPNIASLNVPCGTLEAYSAPTSFWNMFFAGRISENGYNVEVSVNDETFGSVAVESDCSTGTLTATANEGYRFVIWNDGNTENPRTVALTSDTAFTAIFALIDESSLSEDAEFADLSVYPNPTRGKVTFNQAIEKIEVIDLSGKTVQTYENANEINIEALPAGVYHLRMTIGDKTTTIKVIKE